MSAVDTNVLVRYYVRDHEEQYGKAVSLFQKASIQNPVFINHIVLSEWVWVLSRNYNIKKERIIEELDILLDSKEIEIEEKEIVRAAIEEFKNSEADFSDCLISSKNEAVSQNPTCTFDKKASKLKGMKLLK